MTIRSDRDCYATLGVDRHAPTEVIRGAYRALSKSAHPDKGGDPVEFRAITDAYDTLVDPGRREAYDRILNRLGPPSHNSSVPQGQGSNTEPEDPPEPRPDVSRFNYRPSTASATESSPPEARTRLQTEADRRLSARLRVRSYLILIGLPILIGLGASIVVNALDSGQNSPLLFLGALPWAVIAVVIYRWARPKRAKAVADRDTDGRAELILAEDRPLLALGCCVAALALTPIAVSGICIIAVVGAIALVIFLVSTFS